MNKRMYLYFLLLSILAFACVDPYYPDIDKYENTLAIDGMISNEAGPYFIKLQIAATIYHPKFQPLGNATVFITDELGNIENFHETELGVYSNTSADFQGIVGRAYQLTVVLSENQAYHSSWEKIQKPLEIDSVYAEVEYHIDPNLPYTLSGYQFYIDTKESENDSTYLIWRLQSTYKYNSDYKCHFTYSGSIQPFTRTDSLKTCWKTEMVPQIIVGSTNTSSQNKLIRYPLHYVSGEGRELSVRYSVLVNQLVVGETVYKYWKAIRDQNEIQGSLYSQQPYQIRGNLTNVNNPDEPVVGCFIAAGFAKKRVFYDRPPIDFNYEICIPNEADYKNMELLSATQPWEWPIYLVMDSNFGIFYPQQRCIDCRQKGGKLEKPEFWIDN